MKLNLQLLCLALVFLGSTLMMPTVTPAQEKVEAKQEPETDEAKASTISIKGKWNVKTGERAGTEVEEERFPESIAITKDTITIPSPSGDFVMGYEIVSDESPYHVDMTIKEGPGEGNAVGILKMENGTLSLCYDPTGENRPKVFETNEENGCFMFTMKKVAKKLDAAKMVGRWNIVAGTRGGDEVAEDRMAANITFTKDKITIPLGPDMNFIMSYTVDAEQMPATINMDIEEGPGAGGSAMGIVKMEDGKFFLCYDGMGGDRPEDFESTADNGFFLFEMEAVVD